jgi:integrase
VPLSPLALALLQHLRRLTGDTDYILPIRTWRKSGMAPKTVRTLSQALRDQKSLGLAHFTPHDLRRTAASLMTRAGIPRLHVEKVLNHTIDDVAEIYDRYDYAAEKRQALETGRASCANSCEPAAQPHPMRRARDCLEDRSNPAPRHPHKCRARR